MFYSVTRTGHTGRVAPDELTAAVLTGFVVAWAMTTLGIPAVPSVIVGLIVWAAVSGKYRRRWAVPRNAPPEPS